MCDRVSKSQNQNTLSHKKMMLDRGKNIAISVTPMSSSFLNICQPISFLFTLVRFTQNHCQSNKIYLLILKENASIFESKPDWSLIYSRHKLFSYFIRLHIDTKRIQSVNFLLYILVFLYQFFTFNMQYSVNVNIIRPTKIPSQINILF